MKILFLYLYKQSAPWVIGAHFTTGNNVISVFKSNHIGEPIQETPEPVQKTHP
jgi:hypothetical protein